VYAKCAMGAGRSPHWGPRTVEGLQLSNVQKAAGSSQRHELKRRYGLLWVEDGLESNVRTSTRISGGASVWKMRKLETLENGEADSLPHAG